MYNSEPFLSENLESREYPSKGEKYRKVLLFLSIIGFLILAIPTVAIITLMTLGSYMSFLNSPKLLIIIGSIGSILFFVISMFLLNKSFKGISNNISSKNKRITVYVLLIILLIVIIFIIVGFAIFNKAVSGIKDSEDYGKVEFVNNLDSLTTEKETAPELLIIEGSNNLNLYEYESDNPVVSKKEERSEISREDVDQDSFILTEGTSQSYEFTNLIESIINHPIINDLPKSGSIRITFYSEREGENFIDKSFIFASHEIVKEPDIELFIKSEYISALSNNLCLGIQEAKDNGGLKYNLNIENSVLFTKYSGLLGHKNCVFG